MMHFSNAALRGVAQGFNELLGGGARLESALAGPKRLTFLDRSKLDRRAADVDAELSHRFGAIV
jgi:hypothetical protein